MTYREEPLKVMRTARRKLTEAQNLREQGYDRQAHMIEGGVKGYFISRGLAPVDLQTLTLLMDAQPGQSGRPH